MNIEVGNRGLAAGFGYCYISSHQLYFTTIVCLFVAPGSKQIMLLGVTFGPHFGTLNWYEAMVG